MELRKLGLLLGIAPFALGATFFAACGGDDDDGGGGGGGGSGSDEDFVDGLCAAFKDFEDDFSKLLENPEDLANEDDAAEAMAEPFGKLADAFGDLNPPNDLEDWHKDASEALDKVAEQLKDGNFDESLFEDDPLEEPPGDAQERLQKLADDNEDCKEANFDFGTE